MATNIVRETVSAQVRAEMGRHRHTSSDLAAVLGLSQSAAARRLNCVVPFSTDEIVAVADWLRVPVSYLMSGFDRVAS